MLLLLLLLLLAAVQYHSTSTVTDGRPCWFHDIPEDALQGIGLFEDAGRFLDLRYFRLVDTG